LFRLSVIVPVYNQFRTFPIILANVRKSWDQMNDVQQQQLWLRNTVDYILTWPFDLRTSVIAFAKSTGRFFIVGGEGEIHSIFGMEYQPEVNPTAFWGIKGVAVGFTALMRIVGLVGLCYLLFRKHYRLVLICTGLIAYFWLTSLVVGRPRARVPVEPELMVLAAFGIDATYRWLRGRKARRGSAKVRSARH
jgi:hypothetical protein